MAEHTIKLPDVGEGVAEAELVEWHVKVGDLVREDAVLAAVMTDKATVEIPSPVEGKIAWIGGEIGEILAVGSPIVRIDVGGEGAGEQTAKSQEPAAEPKVAEAAGKAGTKVPESEPPKSDAAPTRKRPASAPSAPAGAGAPRPSGEKPIASPSVRLKAKDAGIDLRRVPGSGPAGRVTHEDIDAFAAHGPQAAAPSGLRRKDGVEQVKVVGLRRRIAEKMSLAKSRIPHITYVEEVDVTELEVLRAKLNGDKRAERPRLTLMPFLMRAIVKAVAEQPQINATFDDEAGIINRHAAVNIGMAAQTSAGLVVAVVHHAEARTLFDCAAEANRLAEASRNGTATREELTGSTITITSLGAMGGIATTPVINHPEVAIVGVNKMMIRPMWDGQQFVPRKMMNLSSSFDHRVVDGWDAAVFVQRLKSLLETPALIFVEN